MIRKGVVGATKLFQAFGDSFCFVVIAPPVISAHFATCAPLLFLSFPFQVLFISFEEWDCHLR